MPNMFSGKKKAENTHTYVHIYKKKGERTTSKFKTTKLPKIHNYTHTYKKKLLVKPKTTPTPTHNYKHIKYQRLVKQTKVNTLQERGITIPI